MARAARQLDQLRVRMLGGCIRRPRSRHTRGLDAKIYARTLRHDRNHCTPRGNRVFICVVNNQRTSRGVCNQDPLGPHPRRYPDRGHHHVGSDAVDCLAPRLSASTRRMLDTRGGRAALCATGIFPVVVSIWSLCTEDLRRGRRHCRFWRSGSSRDRHRDVAAAG
jgi:hypothetical protein